MTPSDGPRIAGAVVANQLAGHLRPLILLRGLAALVLGACGFLVAIPSPAVLVRGIALYWLLDGLCTLWTAFFVQMFATRKPLLILRGGVGIGAAVVTAALPLLEVYGHWRPGQLILLIFTVGFVLVLIVLQIALAALIDVPVGLEVRRHVAGEWSVLLAAILSIVLSLLAGIGFARLPVNLAPGLGVIGVIGGCALIAGALRLRREPR
jgi:uncharacterized membrane protein HdeD (DUF308 family)